MKPVQKRGGMRKVAKRKPRQTSTLNFIDNKSTTWLPKKLAQTRILFATDFSAEDLTTLTLFSAWVKANEKYFDSRSNFPIYGFLVGDSRIQTQRAREFLNVFAEDLSWDDPEHHLFQGYARAGDRVWHDSQPGLLDNEETLVENTDFINDPEYPDAKPFVVGIEELIKVKPSNLFIFYLRDLDFLADIQDNIDYLLQVPGVVCDRGLDLSDPIINRFVNRRNEDAPLVYIPENNVTLTPENCEKLFHEFEDLGDDEIAFQIKSTMYATNDSILNAGIAEIGDLPEFVGVDFDDYDSFSAGVEKLSDTDKKEYAQIIDRIGELIKYDMCRIELSTGLAMIGVLLANGTLKDIPLRFDAQSQKKELVIKDVGKATSFFQGMLLKAIKILNE